MRAYSCQTTIALLDAKKDVSRFFKSIEPIVYLFTFNYSNYMCNIVGNKDMENTSRIIQRIIGGKKFAKHERLCGYF